MMGPDKNKKYSDIELIWNIKNWNHSIKRLYNKYIDRGYNFIYFRVKNEQVTQDIVSESWYKIFKNINKFNPEKEYQVSVWIFRILRNTMFDYFKKNKNCIDDWDENLKYIWWDDREVYSNLDNEYYRNIFIKEMKKLSNKEQEIITLRYFSDLKNKEIAKLFSIKEKTVSSLLSRWLKKLKYILKDNDNYKNMF